MSAKRGQEDMVFSFTLSGRDISVDAPPETPLLLVSTTILINTNLAAFAAVAMEVEINDRSGRIRVVGVVAADDSGHIANPDGIRNQVQGGVIQSLSWTLKEEVKFRVIASTAAKSGRGLSGIKTIEPDPAADNYAT